MILPPEKVLSIDEPPSVLLQSRFYAELFVVALFSASLHVISVDLGIAVGILVSGLYVVLRRIESQSTLYYELGKELDLNPPSLMKIDFANIWTIVVFFSGISNVLLLFDVTPPTPPKNSILNFAMFGTGLGFMGLYQWMTLKSWREKLNHAFYENRQTGTDDGFPTTGISRSNPPHQ